jgi:raffinose/stachyose/melibiose transport system permease protein
MKINVMLKRSLFLLPALIIYFLIIVIPSLYSLYLSMFKWNGVGEKVFVGLKNYLDLFANDDVFITAIKNNIIWTLLTIIVTVFFALMLAVLLNREFKGRVVYRGILYFPYVLSGVVVAIMWRWIYHPQLGFINGFLKAVGLQNLTHPWLSDVNIALYAVYIAALWQGVGAPMILFLAGLQTVPQDCLEAALIDGAGKFTTFIRITIPLLKETFVIVLATQIVAALKVFDIVIAMTGGGPAQSTQTLATWMYQQTFRFSNLGTGSAIAWVMVIVLMIVIIPYTSFMARD